MNARQQITLSAVTILLAMASGVAASALTSRGPTIEVSPRITYAIGEERNAIPEPEETPEQWTTPTTIVAHPVAPRARVWTCGEPRRLENDARQTVKVCEWR